MKDTEVVRSEVGFDFTSALDEAKKHPAYWQEDLLVRVSMVICDEMESQGVTRAELAKRLGVSPAYVTKALRGHENMTLSTLARIAFALGKRCQCVVLDLTERMNVYGVTDDAGVHSIRRTETAVIRTVPSRGNSYDESAYEEGRTYGLQLPA